MITVCEAFDAKGKPAFFELTTIDNRVFVCLCAVLLRGAALYRFI